MKKLLFLLLPFTCYANTAIPEPGTTRLQRKKPDWVILEDSMQKLSFKRSYENVISITTSQKATVQDYFRTFLYKDLYRVVKESQTVEHILPEGGMLTYRHDNNNKITEIFWTPHYSHTTRPILNTSSNNPGYIFGNQLVFRAQANSHALAQTQLSLWNAYQKTPFWVQELTFSTDGTLANEKTSLPTKKFYSNAHYSYDPNKRLTKATVDAKYYQQNINNQYHYTWNPNGSRATHHNGNTSNINHDARGLPITVGSHTLEYNNDEKLGKITLKNNVLAEYTYNSHGQRIKKKLEDRDTLFYYENNRLIGEWNRFSSYKAHWLNNSPLISRRYIYAGQLPIAFIEYSQAFLYQHDDHKLFLNPNYFSESTPIWMIPYLIRLDEATLQRQARLFFIHADHIGQPFMVTDENRNIRWFAQNSPTGQSNILYEGIEFNLRMPGQYYDKETGWHYNGQRYYDPVAGHYLGPHPLGEQTNTPPFTYASHQPRRFIDPFGLFSQAFDEQGINNIEIEDSNIKHVKALYSEDSDYYAEPQTLLNRATLTSPLEHSNKNKTENTSQATNPSATNPALHSHLKSTVFLGPHGNIAGASWDNSIPNPSTSTVGKYSDHASLPLTWVDWFKINYGDATCLPHWVQQDPPLIYPEDDPNLKHYHHHPDLSKASRDRIEQLIARIPADIPWLTFPDLAIPKKTDNTPKD